MKIVYKDLEFELTFNNLSGLVAKEFYRLTPKLSNNNAKAQNILGKCLPLIDEKEVKDLANEFANHVSEYTGLSTEEVLSLDAQVFTAKEALSLGLINGIMDQHEFSKYVAENFMTNEWRF